ncbi:hypothetical protein [Kineococcus indalonis]|uniref:hypothetical protein n=1 Tax=Kineococcus indalonis TaxID=2696566 RepID=UPI001412EEDF|nr:hypothetical protein [Kineococcus indalonis]NAZ84539.1 hypothetical protein [Kineococcus indalonis]
MPKFTDEEQRVWAYVRAWYRQHRGALPAWRVSEALDLPCAAVSAAADVLAAAGAVRTHHAARLHEGQRDVLFLDAPPAAQRLIDLSRADALHLT